MREALKRVLTKLVLPINDRLVGVKVSQMSRGGFYVITFYINDRIEYDDGYKIEKEVRDLFAMLGPKKREDFIVQYKMVDEFEDEEEDDYED